MLLTRNIKELNAGMLREVITVTPVIATPDGRGGVIYSNGDSLDVFAAVKELSQSRELEAAQIEFNKAARFYLRWLNLNLNSKITYREKEYTIHSIVEIDTTKRYIQVLAYNKQ